MLWGLATHFSVAPPYYWKSKGHQKVCKYWFVSMLAK